MSLASVIDEEKENGARRKSALGSEPGGLYGVDICSGCFSEFLIITTLVTTTHSIHLLSAMNVPS